MNCEFRENGPRCCTIDNSELENARAQQCADLMFEHQYSVTTHRSDCDICSQFKIFNDRSSGENQADDVVFFLKFPDQVQCEHWRTRWRSFVTDDKHCLALSI